MGGVITPLLDGKAQRRRELASLPFDRKLEIVLELQRTVAQIRRAAGRQGPEPWDRACLGTIPSATGRTSS